MLKPLYLFLILVICSNPLLAAKPDLIYDQDLKYKVKVYKVQKGDGLIAILNRHGVSNELASKSLGSNPFDDDFRFIKGNKYMFKSAITKEKEKQFKFYCPYTKNIYVLKTNGEKVIWDTEKAQLDVEVAYFEGKVDGSILASISHLLDDELAAYRFMDAYQMDYKLRRQLQRNAKFSLHIEKQFDEGHFIRYGEILNTSLEIAGKIDERNFIRFPGGGAFVAKEDTHADRVFYSPVDYIKISSMFKPRRFHPIRKRRIAHLGIDFALPQGAPIYAPAKGKVVKKGRTRGAGNYVVVEHANNYKSYYNHMYKIDESIRVGMTLKPGDNIGQIGCTGYCTMSHLHFAVKKRGRFVDPAPLVRSYPYKHRELFEHRSIH